MVSLTKMQRFMAAVHGEPVDHLPASMWLHFASEHLTAEETARAHVRYFAAYDWDYLKAMNDYRYPLPRGDMIRESNDLVAFRPLPMAEPSFVKQLACLSRIRDELGTDVPIVETLFNPLQTLVRAAGSGAAGVVFAHPQAGHAALEAVTKTLIDYVQALKGIGVTGLFYSVNGASRPEAGGLTAALFDEFVKPYDLRILQAAEGLVRIGHIHGFDLQFERVLDYPVEAYNWSHDNTKPSPAEARRLTQAALIGGIDEVRISRQSVVEIEDGIRRAVREAGGRKLLIGPGCTVPPDTPGRLQYAVARTAKELVA